LNIGNRTKLNCCFFFSFFLSFLFFSKMHLVWLSSVVASKHLYYVGIWDEPFQTELKHDMRWTNVRIKANNSIVYNTVVDQENRIRANHVSILTGATRSQSSCIHNSIIFYPIDAKFAVEVPAYEGRLHTVWQKLSEIWVNKLKCSLLHFFLLRLFAHLTCKLAFQFGWNLVHL